MLVSALDHLDRVAEHLFGPVDQRARVAAIHEHGPDSTEEAKQPHQHGTGRPLLTPSWPIANRRSPRWGWRFVPATCAPVRAVSCSPAPILGSGAKRGIADTPSAREESWLASAATGNRSSPRIERHPRPDATDTCAAGHRHDVLPEAPSAKAPVWPTEHLSNHSDTCPYVNQTNRPRI